jgi:hypothetical protein
MAMVYPKLSGQEITRWGKKHYENLRTQIEIAENISNESVLLNTPDHPISTKKQTDKPVLVRSLPL